MICESTCSHRCMTACQHQYGRDELHSRLYMPLSCTNIHTMIARCVNVRVCVQKAVGQLVFLEIRWVYVIYDLWYNDWPPCDTIQRAKILRGYPRCYFGITWNWPILSYIFIYFIYSIGSCADFVVKVHLRSSPAPGLTFNKLLQSFCSGALLS